MMVQSVGKGTLSVQSFDFLVLINLNEKIMETKSTFRLIILRLWTRERWLTISFLSAILVIVLSKYSDADWFKTLLSLTVDCITRTKEPICAISIGYISGVIVYFLTIILPETRRNIPVMIEISNILAQIKDSFLEFQLEDISVHSFENAELAVQDFVNIVKQYGKYNEQYYGLCFCAPAMRKLSCKLEILTSQILNHSSALSENEINKLIEIRHCDITKKLSSNYGVDELLTESDLKVFFHDIIILDKNIEKFRKEFTHRVFKS